MKQIYPGTPAFPMSHEHDGNLISEHDLEGIAGGGISGHKEAARLLDEHLASLDILSQRSDLSNDQKLMMKSSYEALYAKKLGEAVRFNFAP